MEENKIREIIESVKTVDKDGKSIDGSEEELITALKDVKETPKIDIDNSNLITELKLKEEMKNEPDWRKKMAIAAQIISLNL